MRFTASNYATGWQRLNAGISMGCAISPILFAMAMGMTVRSARECCKGVEMATDQTLPSICAFVNDLVLLNPSTEESQGNSGETGRANEMGQNEV